MPLYSNAVESALVIDTGFLMTEVSPVVHSYFSKIGAKTSLISGSRIDVKLHDFLNDDNSFDGEKLSLDFVEEVKARACKVLTGAQSNKFLKEPDNYARIVSSKEEIKWALKKQESKNTSLSISYRSGVEPYELFFDEEEEGNLVYTILDSLLEVRNLTLSLIFSLEWRSSRI